MDFDRIDECARKALVPLENPWLEEQNLNHEGYRRFLYWLSLFLQPEVSVELGTDLGKTSAHLTAAAAMHGGRVYGFDNRQVRAPGIEKRWPGVLKLLWCDTLGGAQALEHERGKVGLVFQDSSHHGEHSRCEWNYWRPLLAPGAVWVSDDISASFKLGDEPFGMLDYWHWLPGRKKLYEVGRPGNNIGVLLT